MWKELEKKYSVHKGIYAKYMKRIIDLLVTTIGLICISPVFLSVCVLVRIKLGSPIFFKQKRTGKDEKTFEMIKFRTMTDARDENGQLLPDTERFTKFGNFLRNSSLDELPELLNVIKGDMSLVGPRPLLPQYLSLYTQKQTHRHDVRPGITGWAQVNGRNDISWGKKFELDVWYVDHLSFWLDMKIIFLTIGKVLKRDGVSKEGMATTEPFNGYN